MVGLLTEWMRGNELETRLANGNMGGTMRLGAYLARLAPESKVAAIYADRATHDRLIAAGINPVSSTPEEFDAQLRVLTQNFVCTTMGELMNPAADLP